MDRGALCMACHPLWTLSSVSQKSWLWRPVRDLTRHRFFPLAGGDFYWYQNHQIVPEVRVCVDISEMQIDVSV